LLLAGMALDMQSTRSAEDEAAIRALVDGFVAAIRAKDLGGVMSAFAPEVLSFDLGPPLQHGSEGFEQRWRELFGAYQGPIDYQVHGLAVVAQGDVAFSHSLNRVAGTTRDGHATERWLRWTACFRKAQGRWRIVHEHVSVPVDLRSGKAVVDLTPAS
jgi:uncharacterized protein (TIGR02246 family)